MTRDAPRRTLSAIDVLTRAGADRDRCLAHVEDGVDVDALLVSDVLRGAGRVGDTLRTRRALVELCGLVRAMDAAEAGRIDLEDLRRGLALHAGRTDDFADFHDARVLLRTLGEVLGAGRSAAPSDAAPVRAQLALLHRDLRAWLLEELTGSAAGARPGAFGAPAASNASPNPREPFRIDDADDRRRANERVEELRHGARHHPVTGLLGAAWVRGWYAAPVAGDLLGDDRAELPRLAAALHDLGARSFLQVTRARGPHWRLDGDALVLRERLRAAWCIPATLDGVRVAASEHRGATILTTYDDDFAYVEADGHHLVMGPRDFVHRVVGVPPLEAIAAFREHVESLADDDGEPPADLLAVATACGRLRRRSR